MKRFDRLVIALVLACAAYLGWVPEAVGALPFLMGATATTSDIDELMKIVFDDTVITETVYDTELLDELPDGEIKQGSDGRWFETAQLYQSPGSWGSRAENGYIPQPNSAKAINAKINLKKIVGSIEETAEVLKKIKRDKAAFLTWSEEQFPLFKEGLVDEIDRQAVGDGSGIRARANGAAVNLTGSWRVPVDSTIGVDGWDKAVMQFRRGMFLRSSANADGSSPDATVMEVLDLDWDNNAIIVDDASSVTDNDYLFEGDSADNSAGNEAMGLAGLVDDGDIVQTLQAVDRDVYLWFRSYVRDLNGSEISEFEMIKTDRIARQRGGGKVDLIIMSEEAFDTVWVELKADRALNDPRAYTAGRDGITMLFGGTRRVMYKTARKLPSTLVYGIQRNMLRKFLLHEFEWDDTTGSIWKQVVDSTGRKDAFYAYGTGYMELGIKSPQRCWRLEGFAVEGES